MEMKKSMLITAAAVIGLSVNTAYAHSDHDHGGGEDYSSFYPDFNWTHDSLNSENGGTATSIGVELGLERTAATYQFQVTEAGSLDLFTAYTADWGNSTALYVFQKDEIGSDWTLSHWNTGGAPRDSGQQINIFGVPVLDYNRTFDTAISPAGLRDHFDVGAYMALVMTGFVSPAGTMGAENLYDGHKLSQGFEWEFIDFTDLYNVDFTMMVSPNSLAVVQPVPVPAAVWLMGTALLGLIASNKRKQSLA